MWSFLGDRQARVTCWCCNETTRLPRSETDSDTVHDWHCDNCDTQNTVNKEGEIVDSRDEMYREVPGSSQQKLRILSGIESPSSSFPVVVFCKTCQSNQNRVYQLLSEYLPEETDSHYAQRLAEADTYSRTLRRRYPVACKQCQEKVDDLLQSQASWLRKKELASSLRQSERVRKYEPNIRPKPTLRRKGVTMAWLVFALLGFIACPLAALGLYIDTQHGYLDPPWQVLVVGAAISMATFLSSLLNPLWLRAAFSTSIRIAGLPRYRRRIQFLSAGRLAVAVGFFCRRPSRDLAIGLGIVDTCMFVYAFWALEIVSKLRTRSLSRHTSDSDDTGDEATDEATAKTIDSDTPVERARKTDEATSSMGELSLGESVVNRDQNDSLRGTAFAGLHGDHRSGDWVSHGKNMAHRTATESSGGSTVGDELVSMFGLESLAVGGRSRPVSAMAVAAQSMDVDTSGADLSCGPRLRPADRSSSHRPFESTHFQSQDTGLELKMRGFSINDDDDEDVDMEPATAEASHCRPRSNNAMEIAGMDGQLLRVYRGIFGSKMFASAFTLVAWLNKEPLAMGGASCWISRILLSMELFISVIQRPVRAADSQKTRRLVRVLLVFLVTLPVVFTTLSVGPMSLDSMASAWPLWPSAKSVFIHTVWQQAPQWSGTQLESRRPNAAEQLLLRSVLAGDFACELAAIVLMWSRP